MLLLLLPLLLLLLLLPNSTRYSTLYDYNS